MQSERPPHVVIIGAGIAGISMAIALRKQLHFTNFTIYERAANVGGTWRDNTYPGCGSDVPAHGYCLSSELNPDWSSYLVRQSEIRAYWESLFRKYDLERYTIFNTNVISLQWDVEHQLYKIDTQDVITEAKKPVEAHLVVSAIGGFMRPVFPEDVQGVERFGGESWHVARWRHDVDLSGKTVGVIGNGCSAAQLIPAISADPSVKVINFCRSRQWYTARTQYTYPRWVKWLLAHVPFVLRLYRLFIMAQAEFGYVIFDKRHSLILRLIRREFIRYMKRTAPEIYHDKLIPSFPPGCKRIIIDPGYLESLHRPNVSVAWEAIDHIEESGIKLKTGETIPLDIIVFTTGYSLDLELPMRGVDGTTVQHYFASEGGPTAYLGTCIPGLPNLFTLLGPNVATGHASAIFSEETQIQYALQLIKPVIDGLVESFEVSMEASEEYNVWLQKRLSESVWTECHSYYRSDRHKGKIVANFPGPMVLLWWMTRKPRWEHFKVIGGERWALQRKSAMRVTVVGTVAIFMVFISFALLSNDKVRRSAMFWLKKFWGLNWR